MPGLSIDNPRVMDSTAALDLPDIPKSLLVVGGGYIGLELGSVYAALGSKVTVVEMTDGLLPGADRDLVNILAKRIASICEAVLLNTKVASVKDAKDGVTVTFEGQLPEGMAERADVRSRARVRRPSPEFRGARARQDAGEGEPEGLHRDRRGARDGRTDHLRHRRRGRRADARAQGVARSARRHRLDPRRAGGLRAGSDSRGRLHGSRSRVVRPDRERSREAEARGHRHAVPVGRVRAARSRSTAPTA